ncbi:MAG: hypothetical protein L6R37_005684 [Teloschistes peruensis]|nr:MAG: hypothetical protein L6R37_005684 [Teloschistes peruensis]
MAHLIFIGLVYTSMVALYALARYLKIPRSGPTPRACKQLGRSPDDRWHRWIIFLSTLSRRLVHRLVSRQGGLVEGLYVHPIKSCKAVQVQQAQVLREGLKYDRQFSFAELQGPLHTGDKPVSSEASGWKFITQRKYERLANIRIEIWVPDPDSPHYSSEEANVRSDGVLLVRYPDPRQSAGKHERGKVFEIPYNPTVSQIKQRGYSMEKMEIWKDCPDALLIASTLQPDPPTWLTDIQAYIKSSFPLALFRVAASHERQVFRNAPRKDELGYQSVVGFADAYPLHLLGLASVADLDCRLSTVVPEFSTTSALRFRANIYFSGPNSYAEDSWKCIKIGKQVFHVACRTTRCELPNVDQYTGQRHRSEPSKTMKSYRNIDEGAGPGSACLGMQMVPAAELGVIKVGDPIEVLKTGTHYYLKQ